ncbi:MAG: FAD-dependent oxidoreductase [Clostridiales bacterium]|nr:FAD-dependent oxidoreductase [Clostridiales bacterium]MCF8022930.1 FAD-dependent oxidoreductase [Clostridiales bacterium]
MRIKKWLVFPAAFLFLLGAVIMLRPGWVFSGPEPVPLVKSNINSRYDLIVAGGEPEGVAAALSGARNGLSVLLVDTRPVLGGLMTRGWLNSIDMNYGPGDEILNRGILNEFYHQLRGDSFDIQRAVNVFHRMVNKEDNLDVLMRAKKISPIMNKKEKTSIVNGVKVKDSSGKIKGIYSTAVIDATQDADIAAAAGAQYTVGHQDIGRPQDKMAATLVFKLEGINLLDWLKIYYNLRFDNDFNTGAAWRSAWGFYEKTSKYEPKSERISLRGLNIGRQDDFTLLINALQIFDVDPLEEDSREKAKALAARELPHIVDFISREVPGLKGAKLAGKAPELYIRESRHIAGEYRLTINDVLENRDFYDRAAFGSYPVDIQAAGPSSKGYVLGDPTQYAVPFRSLIPEKVNNLLVVGRSASYSALAAGSARTIPVGMAAGQFAGAAAALAMEKDKSFRELAESCSQMQQLQERLNNQGMELKPADIEPPKVTGHWAYPGLKFMRRLGLASGGYNNDYKLDSEMSEQRFMKLLSNAVKQLNARVDNTSPDLYREGNALTIYDVSYVFCRYSDIDMDKHKAFNYLSEKGFWNKELLARIRQNDNVITNGAGYMLIHDFMQYTGYTNPHVDD